MIGLQDLFDSQIEFGTKEVGLLNNLISVQKKFHHETCNESFSDEYFKEMKVIADFYELSYTEPKYRGGLKSVSTPLTLH